MIEMLVAIWEHDLDKVAHSETLYLLVFIILIIIMLESAVVFLPLPGDSLVFMTGALVGLGVIGFETILVYLPIAASLGSLLAYWQGYLLRTSPAIHYVSRIMPVDKLDKASKLVSKYGISSMFLSRFIPFVRVITPMLMGNSTVGYLRFSFVSMVSAFMWVSSIGFLGKLSMEIQIISDYRDWLTKIIIFGTIVVFAIGVFAIVIKLCTKNRCS
ncbi:DedA family protein [Enterobacter hormaechei]